MYVPELCLVACLEIPVSRPSQTPNGLPPAPQVAVAAPLLARKSTAELVATRPITSPPDLGEVDGEVDALLSRIAGIRTLSCAET